MKTAQQILSDHSFNKLWGGTLKDLNYDMLNYQIVFKVDVLENSMHTYYQVCFLGVIEFLVRHDEAPEPWDYIGLTAIEIKTEGELYNIGAELWESEMIIKCQEVNLSVKEKI